MLQRKPGIRGLAGRADPQGTPACYERLADCYDAYMSEGNHARRAVLLEKEFRRSVIPVQTVLDLGCGTGTIACLLARRGYRVLAVDAEAEMLTQAARKMEKLRLQSRPLLIQQEMQKLRLTEPVDAVISTLDAVNYLTSRRDLHETFRRVRHWLRPGGGFFFDVNTPARFRRMDGRAWWEETDDSCCSWRTFYSQRTGICTYQVDLFRQRPDGAWERSFEEHRERGWTRQELQTGLRAAGFRHASFSPDPARRVDTPPEDRWYVRCR